MAIGEPKIDLTLSKGEESVSYAELMEQLHAMVKAKNGKPLSPDEIRIIKEKLEAFVPDKSNQYEFDRADVNIAREILGAENVYGPDVIASALNTKILNNIPDIPFSEFDLELAGRADMCLVYKPWAFRFSNVEMYNPRLESFMEVAKNLGVTINCGLDKDVLKNIDKNSMFKSGWMLLSKNIIKKTDDKDSNFRERAEKMAFFGHDWLRFKEYEAGNTVLPNAIWERHCPSMAELLYFCLVRGVKNMWVPRSDRFVARAFDEEHRDSFCLSVFFNEISFLVNDALSNTSNLKHSGVLFKWEK